jgi:hypothetical protein
MPLDAQNPIVELSHKLKLIGKENFTYLNNNMAKVFY